MEKKEIEKMKKVKVLLYCTKAKPFLLEHKTDDNQVLYVTTRLGNLDCLRINHKKVLNGKIVAECEVETEEIRLSEYPYYDDCSIALFDTPTLTNDELLDKSCLHHNELNDYLIGQKGYALHISNLRIFKEPKRCQDDFLYQRKIEPNFYNVEYFRKAPQNMMKVIDAYGDDEYILISVRPKWLCKILNGEKTIEVRKKVLKEML